MNCVLKTALHSNSIVYILTKPLLKTSSTTFYLARFDMFLQKYMLQESLMQNLR